MDYSGPESFSPIISPRFIILCLRALFFSCFFRTAAFCEASNVHIKLMKPACLSPANLIVSIRFLDPDKLPNLRWY